MNSIDIKSLLIGALLTSTVIFGVAATGKTDTWDSKQQWSWMKWQPEGFAGTIPKGYEPVAPAEGKWVWTRKRFDN